MSRLRFPGGGIEMVQFVVGLVVGVGVGIFVMSLVIVYLEENPKRKG